MDNGEGMEIYIRQMVSKKVFPLHVMFQNVKMSASNITFYYWDGFTGRGEPILLLLQHAGVAYNYSHAVETVLAKHPKLLACPLLVDGDTVYSQTIAILNYLAKKFHLMPADETRALQMSLNMGDLWSESYDARKGADGGAAFLKDRLGKWLDVLEHNVQGKYFFGDHLSYVDFHVLTVIHVLDFMYGNVALDPIASRPKLAAWLKVTKALPSVQEFYKKKLPILYDTVKAKY